ncbi:hypothetical protein ACFOUW_17255 [Tenggerimyces flavus]|uniref:Secreted protein n=2 Tax=Tenggerimyces flavus TaxID=1708749 RepID=A0ABV7YEW2_9ACTN
MVNRMQAGVKIGGFVVGLAAMFGVAFAVGSAAAPPDSKTAAPKPTVTPTSDGMAGHGETEPAGEAEAEGEGHGDDGHGGAAEAATYVSGLAATEAGFTLVPAQTTLTRGPAVPFTFTVTGPTGKPVTEYTKSHEKDLHLIVVRRDLSGFQHVHPTRAADGSWSVDLDLRTAGSWRVFADFKPTATGETTTLGTDVTVAGDFRPVPLPAVTPKSTLEGYDVSIAGHAVAGEESTLTFTLAKNGKQLADLQPYLGAFGHLVSLRASDLAYLHTHPAEEAHAGDTGGPAIEFATTFPTPGTYRLFLDFQHAGQVHTAEFTVEVTK